MTENLRGFVFSEEERNDTDQHQVPHKVDGAVI